MADKNCRKIARGASAIRISFSELVQATSAALNASRACKATHWGNETSTYSLHQKPGRAVNGANESGIHDSILSRARAILAIARRMVGSDQGEAGAEEPVTPTKTRVTARKITGKMMHGSH